MTPRASTTQRGETRAMPRSEATRQILDRRRSHPRRAGGPPAFPGGGVAAAPRRIGRRPAGEGRSGVPGRARACPRADAPGAGGGRALRRKARALPDIQVSRDLTEVRFLALPADLRPALSALAVSVLKPVVSTPNSMRCGQGRGRRWNGPGMIPRS